MAENKTKPTEASVEDFLNGVADEQQRQDAFKLLALMQQITKTEPKMWGPSIVGFGKVHYKYASGREGDMGLVGFSPRKGNLTIYLSPGTEAYGPLLAKLGKHKTGKVCLYIKRLDDVHLPTLKELVRQSVKFNKQRPKT